MPTIEELLAKLVKLSGPCPEICDGTIPLGGTGGTSTVSIITGLPVTPYPVIEPSPYFTLTLTFDDILNAPVSDPTKVSEWNTFFDLPTFGKPFTGVGVIGNIVTLTGGKNIKLKNLLFFNFNSLLEISDTGCVTSVYNSSFNICTSLTTIDLPSVTTAGDYSFANCPSLSTVNLPLLSTTGEYCFYNCTTLSTINLPQLISTGNQCFQDCSSLTTVDMANLTTANGNSFIGCTSLTTVNLPSLITTGAFCFQNCTSLTTIDLPNLVTVGYSCFRNCTSLTTIDLPSCTDLGGSTGNDFVFFSIIGNTITATFNSVLATCNSGNPDGDIQYLGSNNTVAITYV